MNITKIYTNLVVILLALSLVSCAGAPPPILEGEVSNLFHGTAQWVIDGCLSGQCGTEMFTKGNLVVYARPFIESVAFVITDKGIPVSKLTGVEGNLVSNATWDGFKQWLTDSGFKLVIAGTPTYHTLIQAAINFASSSELIPIFGIVLTPAGELPEWVEPVTSVE